MKKQKIAVYAICKNEEQFVDRWYEAVKDADVIVVVDTGSTDNTVAQLKKYPISVYEREIKPWRFDEARNISLDLVPQDVDICVCLDLDEIIAPGWRQGIEKLWQKDTTRLRYIYNWYIADDGTPKVTFYAEKIHARHNFRWVNPVHEVLKYQGDEKQIFTDEIIVNHYPDRQKSRVSYLPLLELAVQEDPDNDRNVHYLGREYMYYGKWNEAIDTLIKHLNLKSATWKDERCASMRFIARSYQALNRYNEAEMWLTKAIAEAPYLRDPYVEMAMLHYTLQNWDQVIYYLNDALKIKTHEKTYINEVFSWDETINDLLSIAYYYTNDIDKAIQNAELALKINPSNQRLKDNLKFFKDQEKSNRR